MRSIGQCWWERHHLLVVQILYDDMLRKEIEEAEDVDSIANLYDYHCVAPATVKATYNGLAGFEQAARRFGFISDAKAGVPRTAYKGVVTIHHNGCKKLFVPEGGEF